jgi:hypothetical protein
MNALTLADALATKYASGALTPPTGYAAVRVSTARIPNAIPLSPFVLVTVPEGELTLGSSELNHSITCHVLFHYGKASGDTARDTTAMLSWIGVLLTATWADMDLGVSGTRKAYPTKWEQVVLTHGGEEYYGWDITVVVDFRETQAFSS